MFRRLVRFPNRPLLSLLAASSLMAAACSGEISSPAGLFDGAGEKSIDDPTNGPVTGIDDSIGSGDRPAGAGDPSSPNGVGWSTRFPKLSNQQWENTVQALFSLSEPTGASADFTQEPLDKAYVSVASAELTVGGDSWARYQTAAEKVAALVVADDAKLAKITPPGTFADANAKGAAFIAAFGRRAYRRPLTSEEKTAYLGLFKAGAGIVGGDAYEAGVRVVLEAMLQSPFFLYRVESADKASKDRKIALGGNEIATRLSYALWNSMPSEELFAAASAGELDTKEGVARWAGKLLDDPRAKEVLLSFHEQTYQVASYGTQDKDPSLAFNADELAPVLKQEARKFFEYVLDNGGGIAEVLTEPTAFVNEDTAAFYGLSGIDGKELVAQQLDPAERIGLFTQLGFLSTNATRKGSDPIHRGLMVARKILCDDPDPPPQMFDLPVPNDALTTREVYEDKTGKCGGSCHNTLINPPGFAFEVFDSVGKVRSTEAGKPIDATGTMAIRQGYTSAEKAKNPKGEISFDGAVDMISQLASEPRTHECYARNWMQFIFAREVDAAERGAWEALRDVSIDESSARSLLISLVQLDAFRTRVSDAQ